MQEEDGPPAASCRNSRLGERSWLEGSPETRYIPRTVSKASRLASSYRAPSSKYAAFLCRAGEKPRNSLAAQFDSGWPGARLTYVYPRLLTVRVSTRSRGNWVRPGPTSGSPGRSKSAHRVRGSRRAEEEGRFFIPRKRMIAPWTIII